MNGSGVAAGDIDGDGRSDLYFCAIEGTNRLYRNLGGWRFEDITDTAGVGCPQWHSTGAILADWDGDGALDLLVSTLGGGVHAFHNDGRGHFTEVTAQAGLASDSGSMSLALGDVDGDGSLDLYVANYGAFPVLRSAGRAQVKQVNGEWVVQGPNAKRLRVVDQHLEEVGEVGVLYLNDGKGHFRSVPWGSTHFVDEKGRPKAGPPDYGLSVQIRDMDGDGFPDIYVCNDFQTPDRLWFNDGHGRFHEASRLAVRKFPFASMGVDFADIDRDGRLDFMAVEMAGRTHDRRLRMLSGNRATPNFPGRFEHRPEVPRNTLYRGNGDRTWSEIAEFAGVAATDWSWQPVFVDVDLDGYEDLLIASGMMFDTQDRDTLDRIRAAHPEAGAQGGTNLLLYPPLPSPISAFHNNRDLTFTDMHEAWGFGVTNIFQGIALVDLDGDGDLDLVCNCLNGAPAMFRNESSAPRIAVRLKGLPPNTRGINGRIKVTGGPVAQTQEIIAGGRFLSCDDAMRVFAAGDARTLGIEVQWRSGRRSVIAAARPNTLYEIDERAAGPAEPAAAATPAPLFVDRSASLKHSHHEKPFDDFSRQPLLPKQLSSLGPAVAWADLAGDGNERLVIGAGRGGKIGGFRYLESGGFEPLPTDWIAPDDVAGMAAWVTPEGSPALLAAVGNYETAPARSSLVVITERPGNGALEVVPFDEVPGSEASLGPLAVVDYDGDGQLDLFVGGRVSPGAYPTPPPSRLYHRRNGHLTPDEGLNSVLESAGMVSGAVWTDLEGDGFPELVLACEWGPVRLFRNHHGQLAAWDPPVAPAGGRAPAVPLSSLTGWWTSVNAGDFDGDGRMDLVVGNWGLNTGYQAARERPLRLYYGNLTGNGPVDLLESYYPAELDVEMPRRSRNALAQAFPFLAARFPTHGDFARAPMSVIVAALPGRPAVVAATTLESMALLNRGDSFVAVPLPPEAQFSPVFGVSVADVDGDGREDLLVAQNFFAMRPEWPRTDAGRGLVLLGDGRGGFRPMDAERSGIAIYGEQRGCAAGDFDHDGRVDWVVAQNGAETKLYQNQSAPAGLRVRIQGPSGNPAGIGSVLRVKTAAGWGPAREIHAGSGYGSQESMAQVFRAPGEIQALSVRAPGGAVQELPVSGRASVVAPMR